MRTYREKRKKKKKKKESSSEIKRSDKIVAICAFVILFFLALITVLWRAWYLS